jgi:hypothetical protein
VVVAENDRGARRRSIYLQQRRTQPVAMLDVFDGARMDPNCVARTTSTVALQSLALLNSDFVRRCSRSFARHLARTGTSSVERVFALALGRPPLEAERQAAEDFLRTQGKHYEGKADVSERVWGDFCQMLLASDMFLYVD